VSGPHRRNFGPMMQSPRCGAKTRAGAPCRAPATRGRARCRMHGGAKGSGAPNGNRNALRHGVYTSEAIEWRRQINRLLRKSRALNAEI
jgi:hypothetical protein